MSTTRESLWMRGGVEFLAVLLGISGSLLIDEWREDRRQHQEQLTILESVYEDILQTEQFITEARMPAFQADSAWMDFFSTRWEDLDVDSVARALSRFGTNASFHNTFLDFREFHPPISGMELIMQDGSLKEIHNPEIRRLINRLIKTDLQFVLENVQTEIDMQIAFRQTLVDQDDPVLARVLSVSQSALQRGFDGDESELGRQAEELQYVLSKNYVRTYLNLKNRNRYFIMIFIRQFRDTLAELKEVVEQELEEGGRGTGAVSS